jgi:hypothetical protein
MQLFSSGRKNILSTGNKENSKPKTKPKTGVRAFML